MKKENKINLLFIACQLVEGLFWENYKILNETYRIKFTSTLTRLKWLNKDIEKLIPDSVEAVEGDVEELYTIVEMSMNATNSGKGEEFIEYLKKFEC